MHSVIYRCNDFIDVPVQSKISDMAVNFSKCPINTHKSLTNMIRFLHRYDVCVDSVQFVVLFHHATMLSLWATQLFKRLELNHKDKDKDLFIGPQEFVVGYSKAPEQPQSSARPICHSHAMTRTGREPATIRTAAYIWSSPRYALRHEICNNYGQHSSLLNSSPP